MKYIPDMDFDIMFENEYIGHIKIENAYNRVFTDRIYT